MGMPSTKALLLNAAASLIAVGAVAGVVRTWIAPASLQPCSDRYATSMAFPLERNGALVTAADIQARSGGGDASLLQNLQVAALKAGAVSVAMGVSLPKGSGAPSSATAIKGGISFPWQPRSLKDKVAVCLSYKIMLPEDFEFNRGGALPGLSGQDEQSGDGFLVRPTWAQDGTIGMASFATLGGQKFKQQDDTLGSAIPRGRWVSVDQEVVLNAPDQENGVLRIWIDGALTLDRSDLAYRVKPEVAVSMVAADFFYEGDEMSGRSPRDAKVWLSPFEVRWP
jgi:hypothetical protein